MYSALTSTGSIAAKLGMFRVSKSDRVKPAIRIKGDGRQMVVIDYQGDVKTVVCAAPVAKRPRVRNRFVLQSLKRTSQPYDGYRPEKGEGTSCPIRVITRTIHVGRPEYQGAGVWA